MMDLTRSRLAIALAVVAIICPSTFSAPATRSSCATPVCRQSHDSKLNYQEGKTYTYGFETEVVTELAGSSDETSKIKVKGQAVLAAQSSCDFILTLQQVAIQSPSGEAISRIDDIEGSSLRFAYQNGEIESLCVSEDDPTWSANVKRAIASMLTNKASKASDDKTETMESDISGRCPTYYTVNGDKYTKTRDLNSCTHRDGGASIFYGVPYDVASKYNSNPSIISSLTCEQEITNQVFQTISCVEKHKIAGLTTESSGVRTEIKSSLTLTSTQDGLQKGAHVAAKPSSIFFDHADIQEVQRQKTSASRAVDILNKLCQEVESGAVSSKVPGLFIQLKKAVKSARKDDLKQMYEQITSGRMCNKATEKLGKLFLDAAAMSGSDGAIAFVAEIIASDKAECHTKALFNMYTTFAPRPGVVALQAAESLISGSDVESRYILTASGLAHQYCKMTNHKCASNNEYVSLVDKIAQHVRSASNEEGIKKVVSALQALGNLDQLTPAAVTAVQNLLKDKSTSERLRVRALDAFRRNPCQEQLKHDAMKIFSHVKESSQVRIQAYLALTQCPQQKNVEAVQAVLDNEKSNQVASFVLSHIENVLESASPAKQGLKGIFRQLNIETLQKNFPRDARKFSRNVELSTFSADANLGGSVDGNVIFSQDSFIPRTASANLTVDAFGRSYNFLEVGLYAEDFEHLLEKYLGPTGKVRTTSFEDLLTKGAEKWNKFSEGVRNRFKRAVSVEANQNEIDTIGEKVNIDERTGEHGVGDFYIRVMGTSVLVQSFSEETVRQTSLTGELKRGFEKMVDGAKDHKFDITEPIMFLDDEVIVSTFSGLPLNIHLEGTSVLSLQMQGNLDIPALFRGNGLKDMRAKIIPSAATVLKAKMTVGAGPIESGLQLEGKIHSSSGVDLKVVQEDKKFEVRFNIPQERTQVIDIRTDVYWIEQTSDSLEKKTSVTTKLASKSLIDNECMSVFSKVLGLKVCADVKVPRASMAAPFVLLNGPSVLSLSVEKSESSMEGYYLKVEADNEDNNFSVDVLLDTPGSRTNRKIAASLHGLKYKSTTPEYKIKVDSPWNKLDIEYKRSFTDDLKGFNLKVVSDGDAYNGKVQLKKITAGDVHKYEPVVEYTLPGGQAVKLVEGQVVRMAGKKLDIDIRTAGPIKAARGSIKGSVELPRRDQDGYQVVANNLVFASELAGQIVVDGTVARTNNVYDSKINFKYGKNAQHTFDVETTVGKPDDETCVLKAKTRSSRRVFLNLDLDWEVVQKTNSVDHKLTYSRGLEEPKVHISQKSKIHVESNRKFEIHNELTVKHPTLNIDFHTNADAKAAPGEARHAELLIQGKSLKATVRYDSNGQNVLDYVIKANAELAGKTYEFSEVSSKVNDNKQNFKSRVAVTPGFWYEANTDVGFKFEKSDMESSISTTITSDKLENPIIFKTEVKGKPVGYEALLKLNFKGKDYVDVLTRYKYTKAAKPATVNVKVFVLGYLDSKMTQTWSRGAGNVAVDAKWIPTGRKVTLVSELSNQGDVYDFESDFKWDADRDQTKSATIKSVTSLSTTQWTVDSKNDVTIVGRLSKVNMKGTVMKEFFNGEDNFELSYTSHEGKTYTVATVLNLENKRKIKAGKINVKVTLDGQKPYDFTLENRVSNLDLQELTADAVTVLTFDYKGEKDIKLRAEASSALPGNFRAYSAKVEASGSIIPQPISYDLKADIKTGKWAVKGSGSRGSRKGDFDVTVDYDKWAPKKTLAVKYAVNTPFDRVSALQGQVKVGYLFQSWTNFEYVEEASFALNQEQPTEWKALASVLQNEFRFTSELKNENKAVFALSANGKLAKKKLTTDVELTYREEPKSYVSIEIDHELPNVDVTIKGGSPAWRKRSFELKVSHKKTANDVYETDVLSKSVGELAFRVTNKLEISPLKKSIDLLIAAAEEPTRRVYFLVNEAEKDKYNVEALVRWGDGGKFVSSKGELVRSQEAFDADLTLDSPELNAKMLNVKLSKKSAGRQILSLKVDENSKEQFSAEFDFGKKEERSGLNTVYDGSVKIKGEHKLLKGIDFDGKFHLEDSTLERQRDNEDGRKIRASVEIARAGAPIKISGVAKTSDKEKQVKLSVCTQGENTCRNGDIHFKHQHESNGDLEYGLRIVGETVQAGEKSVTGVTFRTVKSENGRQCEHVVKLILNKEKSEQVGYRFYRKDGNEIGAEILLPERVIASVLVGENPRAGDYKIQYNFYMDKTRQPNRKLSIIFNTVHKPRSAEHGFGRETELVLKHPDISKDLVIKTKLSIGGDKTFVDLETVLDVFKANSEIVIVYKAYREVISEGQLYSGEWSVKSKGQNINFGGKSELKRADGRVTYTNVLNYENREKQIKSAKIEALLSWTRVSFEVEGGATKLVSIVSAFEKHGSGFEVRQEYLLPGMEDARIIQTVFSTNPKKIQAKTYTSNSASGVFYEAFIGFKNEDKFIAGLYDHEVDGKKVLADFTVALNHSRILTVKADWDRKNIKNVVAKAQVRGTNVGKNLKDLTVSSVEEILKEAQFITTNLRKASPNFKTLLTNAKDRLADLAVELDAHDDTKLLVEQFKAAQVFLRQYVRVAKRVVYAAVFALKEAIETLPELMKQYTENLPSYTAEDIEEWVEYVMGNLIEVSRKTMKLAGQTIDRIVAASPKIIERINWFLDISSDAGQCIRKMLEVALDEAVNWWKAIRTLTNNVLENSTVKMVLKDIMTTAEMILAEIVQESKNHAESFKNYVLQAVPQKEFHEVIEAVAEYVEKKAKSETVDDAAAIKDIYEKLVVVLKKIGNEIFTIDLKDGFFLAKIPVPVKSLKELYNVFDKITIPRPPKVSYSLPSYNYGIRETINKFRNGASINEIIPPFSAYGLLLGSQYYKTFDGQFFRFEGNCQYLLASDFDNGNFSIVVDYDNQGSTLKKSIIVTDQKNTVAIKPDSTVVVNGQQVNVDSPVEAGSFVVERKGDWIVVSGAQGVKAGCAMSQDVCGFKVDGYYHGKVLGLLGKFNLEQFDDMSTPTGEIVESVDDLAKSWKIDNQCREQAVPALPAVSASVQEKCATAFGSSSSLRPCYQVVERKDFQTICENLSATKGYDVTRAVCTAASGYAKACKMSYAPVDTLEECRQV